MHSSTSLKRSEQEGVITSYSIHYTKLYENSFLILQGVETLPARARIHTANAQRVAEHLASHPAVAWVGYAGLSSHPDHGRAKKYFPLGPGAVFGFGLKGGFEAGKRNNFV